MPLIKSASKEAVAENIREMMHSGHPQRQAVAAALETARRAKRERASGGKVHLGPITGDTPGRTDVHEMNVPDGAYVIPADVVSHMGENNTEAGLARLEHQFGGRARTYAKGGSVPVITASGEFVVSPEKVKEIGGGDLDMGHKILDRFVLLMRKKHIDTLKRLPGPAKD
jgi:hypothetical protein